MVNHLFRVDGMGHEIRKLQETMTLVASNYDDVTHHNRVYNKSMFEPVLHIRVDLNVHKSCRLLSVYNLDTKEFAGNYDYDELGRPWIDINTSCLDSSIGLHVYVLEFVNLNTNDTFYQYFNYTIQSDKPDKPYIYMDR